MEMNKRNLMLTRTATRVDPPLQRPSGVWSRIGRLLQNRSGVRQRRVYPATLVSNLMAAQSRRYVICNGLLELWMAAGP
jgi:hypothetical protein